LTEVGVTETPLTLIETVVNLPKSVPVKVIGVPPAVPTVAEELTEMAEIAGAK
jgi:hypothetical protein